MKIKYINKNQKTDLLIFSGWSFDYKIFETLNFQANFIVCDFIVLKNYQQIFSDFFYDLKNNNDFYVLCWSMGNYILIDLLQSNYQIFRQKPKKIFMIAAALKFDEQLIDNMILELQANKTAALDNFYKKVFFGDKQLYKFFLQNFRDYYVNLYQTDYLIETLNYLKICKFQPHILKDYSVILVHSEKDIIAPFSDFLEISKQLENANTITTKFTHVPFLYKEVLDKINAELYNS
ncbi:MAG TPA: hypothetical protein PLM75_04590 [bacterium]|nr:hypothetical protein [bacterium]HPP87121.1 hypothetical protein [bacterium]